MMPLESGSPCGLCAVRPDVACRHRPADPTWRMLEPVAAPDKRRNNGGLNARNRAD